MSGTADTHDELSRGMDRWQTEMTVRLMTEHGHPWGAARLLAEYSRTELEMGLRRPLPMIVLASV